MKKSVVAIILGLLASHGAVGGYLDDQIDSLHKLQHDIAKSYQERYEHERSLSMAYEKVKAEDPNLPMPVRMPELMVNGVNMGGGLNYGRAAEYLLDKLAQGNYRSPEEVSFAIDRNPLLVILLRDPDEKDFTARRIFSKSKQR